MFRASPAESVATETSPDLLMAQIAAAADPDYRTLPIQEAFDWQNVFTQLDIKPGRYQLFDFNSVAKAKSGYTAEEITDMDLNAVNAANDFGIVYYFSQGADENGNNRSWCLWRNRESARAATTDSRHDAARYAAPEMYESATTQWLTIEFGENGEVTFDDSESGPIRQIIGHLAVEAAQLEV